MATKGTKNKKIEAAEAQSVLDSVKDMDLNKVVTEISGLQVSVQNSLAGLSATLSHKIQKMQEVDTAITLKEQRLQELFQIEKEAVALDELRAQKEEEEISWEQERLDRETAWEEEAQERDKLWKRTEEEHAYAVTQNQRRIQDEFNAVIAQRTREENARQDSLQKIWNDRENTLKTKEKEVSDLQTQVASFDTKMKAEVNKAEAIIGNSMKKQHDHEVALMRKDMESERNMTNIKVSSLTETIKNLDQQLMTLQTQLVSARNDAKEVASQALQSASGRQVAEALQKVVDSNQVNSAKSK